MNTEDKRPYTEPELEKREQLQNITASAAPVISGIPGTNG